LDFSLKISPQTNKYVVSQPNKINIAHLDGIKAGACVDMVIPEPLQKSGVTTLRSMCTSASAAGGIRARQLTFSYTSPRLPQMGHIPSTGCADVAPHVGQT
jgi:hypothetical protein